jgi:hypothetical protein
MKKAMLVVLFVTLAMSLALGQSGVKIPQISNLTQDVLGAHNAYGRGCIACHSPHSGPAGNNGTGIATSTGAVALWGEDLTPLYGQVINFSGDGQATYQVTLPANQAAVTTAGAHDPTVVILFCLSCHDGNLAKPGMMKGQTVETLPIVGGNAPTFLGNDGSGAGNYGNDHPVGVNAAFTCGGPWSWDCTISGGKVSMTGPNSSVFVQNYGFAVSLSTINGTTPVVTCTSCHDQHSELVYSGTMTSTAGNYQTAFFLRGYYNPTTGGNNAAQFCRQCHGGEANESHGQYLVPTT